MIHKSKLSKLKTLNLLLKGLKLVARFFLSFLDTMVTYLVSSIFLPIKEDVFAAKEAQERQEKR